MVGLSEEEPKIEVEAYRLPPEEEEEREERLITKFYEELRKCIAFKDFKTSTEDRKYEILRVVGDVLSHAGVYAEYDFLRLLQEREHLWEYNNGKLVFTLRTRTGKYEWLITASDWNPRFHGFRFEMEHQIDKKRWRTVILGHSYDVKVKIIIDKVED